jgi:hypothetical protein
MMLFIIFSLLSILIGIVLFKRQNTPGKIGGPICKAKGFWLYYTIYNWFFLLPLSLFYHQNLSPLVFNIFLVLTASMWIRGIAEIYMLFVSKNWTPIIGISHDILTILMMFACFWGQDFHLLFQDTVTGIFTISLFLSMFCETYYAYSFYQLMKGRTQGDDGLWYAHEEDPQFKKIILITTIFNYVLYSILLLYIFNFFKHLKT